MGRMCLVSVDMVRDMSVDMIRAKPFYVRRETEAGGAVRGLLQKWR